MGYPSSEISNNTNNIAINNSTSTSCMSHTWVIPLRAPLKPIYTTTTTTSGVVDEEGEEERSETTSSGPTTPTSECSRIPSNLPCPPPPRKRKPSSASAYHNMMRCKTTSNNNINNNGKNSKNNNNKLYTGKREFFITPPDLEAVFIRRHNVGC